MFTSSPFVFMQLIASPLYLSAIRNQFLTSGLSVPAFWIENSGHWISRCSFLVVGNISALFDSHYSLLGVGNISELLEFCCIFLEDGSSRGSVGFLGIASWKRISGPLDFPMQSLEGSGVFWCLSRYIRLGTYDTLAQRK